MYGLSSFNSTLSELRQSAYKMSIQDDAELARISFELIKLYEGNQLGGIHRYIEGNFRNEELRRRYKALATFQNITRLLVDRVSTLGQLPIRVVWKDAEGEPHPAAQALWDDVSANWMGEANWTAVIPCIARNTELCKTVVAAVTWTEEHGHICLDYFTPNQISVGYSKGPFRQRVPDRYYILKSEEQNVWQAWDFADGNATVYDSNIDGTPVTNEENYPVINPRTQFPAIPFVAFRTSLPRDKFFVWDGQAELLAAQEFVNRIYTQLAVQLHYGSFKVPILAGAGWTDPEGNLRPLVMDPSAAILEPFDPFTDGGGGNKIRWDGPASEETIRVLLDTINHALETAASTFGISPSAIRAKNEATSGYALQIESAALRGKHASTRTLAQQPLSRLVELIRWTWDLYQPGRAFPVDAQFTVQIPDYGSGVTTREEVDADIAKMKAGLICKSTLILKYNPGIASEAVSELMDEEDPAEDQVEAATLVSLVGAGILTVDEARAEMDLPPLVKQQDGMNPDRIQRAFLESAVLSRDELRQSLGVVPLGGEAGAQFVEIGAKDAPKPAAAAPQFTKKTETPAPVTQGEEPEPPAAAEE